MAPPVKPRVSQGGLPERVMPVIHRALPRANGRAAPVPVFQAGAAGAAVLSTAGRPPPGSAHQSGRVGQRGPGRRRAAVALGDRAGLAAARQP